MSVPSGQLPAPPAGIAPVRCAVVGLGLMGIEHARALVASARAELLVCGDSDPHARERLPEVPFTDSLAELLDTPGLEAVFVCTPESAHRSVVVEALERGLAVFCEKPLASSVEDCEEMIAAADASTGSLVTGHLLRFDARFVELASEVERGDLGRPVHLASRRVAGEAEGRLVADRTTLPFYLGVHDLDAFRWLAGPIASVFSVAGGAGVVAPEAFDSVMTVVEFESGAVGSIQLSWALPERSALEWDCHLSFVGSRGVAALDLRDTGLSLFTGAPRFLDLSGWPTTYGIPHGSLFVEVEYFLRALRGGPAWPQSLGEARDAVVAAAAMQRSIDEGRPVALSELAAGVDEAQPGHGARERGHEHVLA